MTERTFIRCPDHPNAFKRPHFLAELVPSDRHTDCPKHGTGAIKAGTQAYKDARRLWIPDGPTTRNVQLDHTDGRLDAIVRPETLRVSYDEFRERTA